MHRIDGPGATVDNKFTEGDPVGGVQATVVTAPWLNDMQENVMAVLAAAGVSPTKDRAADLLDSIKKVSAGRLLRTTIYINNGGTLQSSVDGAAFTNASSTFTKHPDAIFAEVEAQGGGGSGGNAASTGAAPNIAAGCGGGGGGWAFKRFPIGVIHGLAVTVGAGGAGGALANGGTSSIGGVIAATGGPAGATGANGPASNIPFGLVTGGIGSGGDINARGGMGFFALYSSTSLSGKGGSSKFGEGGAATSGAPSVGTPGLPADSWGAGGGGAANGSSVPSTVNGGPGKSGIVIIKEYA